RPGGVGAERGEARRAGRSRWSGGGDVGSPPPRRPAPTHPRVEGEWHRPALARGRHEPHRIWPHVDRKVTSLSARRPNAAGDRARECAVYGVDGAGLAAESEIADA